LIITNNQNLPLPIYKAILNDAYKQVGDITTTSLIKPIRARILEKRHDNEIKADASDMIYALLGQTLHAILERAGESVDWYIVEERYAVKIAGWVLTGQMDSAQVFFPALSTLYDYKLTSYWVEIFGSKTEYEQQCNINRYLMERNTQYRITNAEIIAIYRDWSKRQAARNKDYPQKQVKAFPQKLWSIQDTHGWIENRIKEIQRCENLPDDKLPYCTEQERWAKPTKYAVMKKGRKPALRVLDSEDKAQKMAQDKGKGCYVEIRPSESVRCMDYCYVAPFCNQWREIQEKAK